MRKLNVLEMNRLTVEEFKAARKLPLVVVLDNVRSLHNVGSVFRSCDAFRIEAVYLCGITATPPSAEIHKTALGAEDSAEIHKTALGAEDSVSWKYYESTLDAVEELKQKGYFVYSIEQVEGSENMAKISLDASKRYAVVLGNEVKGVEQAVVNASDSCLEIPQLGTKHSLNVSVTAGIVVWEFAKQLAL